MFSSDRIGFMASKYKMVSQDCSIDKHLLHVKGSQTLTHGRLRLRKMKPNNRKFFHLNCMTSQFGSPIVCKGHQPFPVLERHVTLLDRSWQNDFMS